VRRGEEGDERRDPPERRDPLLVRVRHLVQGGFSVWDLGLRVEVWVFREWGLGFRV